MTLNGLEQHNLTSLDLNYLIYQTYQLPDEANSQGPDIATCQVPDRAIHQVTHRAICQVPD